MINDITKNNILICPPKAEDEIFFLSAMKESKNLHAPWVIPPLTHEDFITYLERNQQSKYQSYLAFKDQEIIGVFNLSEIVRGVFQSAYLGFYAVAKLSGQGLMSAALKLVLHEVFTNLDLHRLEANIQPENLRSIHLVKSNGFKKEGFSPRYLKINGDWKDHERWAITIEEWNY